MWKYDWHTQDEIEFLRGLNEQRKFRALRNACRIILFDCRRWDPGVDVSQVKAFAQLLLDRMEAESEAEAAA